MAWCSHLLKNFIQFAVIHIVKGFGVVNKQKWMFFWNSLAFLSFIEKTDVEAEAPILWPPDAKS